MEAADAVTDEIRWRRGALATAIAVTTAGCWYLVQVLRVSHWKDVPVALLFVFTEAFSVLTLSAFLWSMVRYRRRAHVAPTYEPVDVFIPTLNEPLHVLEPTIRAALSLRWPERVRVLVLDDGNRPELGALAASLGAHYHARPDHSGAKAGNLNVGLGVFADPAPLLCSFDADMVATPEFLERTVGQLSRPGVALVQTPQYYRLDGTRMVRVAAEQQGMMCDRMAPSRDASNTVFCMGSGFVIRRAALDAVGGFPVATTEDYLLTLELLAKGMHVAYVHEPLVIGLAPPTLPAFIKQQTRWAMGTVECVTSRRDLLRRVGFRTAFKFSALPLKWFYAITVPVYLGIVLCQLAAGWQPFIETSPLLFASQMVWAVTALGGLWLAVRRVLTFDGFLIQWGAFVIAFRAIGQLIEKRRRVWAVSQKVRRPREPSGSLTYLRLSAAVVAATAAAVASRGYQVGVLAPMVVSGTNALALLLLAIRFRDDDRHYDGERAAALPTM